MITVLDISLVKPTFTEGCFDCYILWRAFEVQNSKSAEKFKMPTKHSGERLGNVLRCIIYFGVLQLMHSNKR